jgi:hypothetical protein
MTSPILLSAVANGVVPGTEVQLNPQLLRNPFNTPMLINEVRVSVEQGSVTGGSVHVELKLGRTPLTKGFVPAWLLGKMLNSIEMNNAALTNTYTWRFPKPLFVPAAELLSASIRYRNDLFGTLPPVPAGIVNSVRVDYAGRTLPGNTAVPPILQVPFVAAYIAPPVSVGVGAVVAYLNESTEVDLCNPFNGPLYVQRFLGRLMVNNAGADIDAGVAGALVTNKYDVWEHELLVRMTSSEGKITVRDEVPFGHLFSAVDRAWTVGDTLIRPKAFYRVTLRTGNLAAMGGGAPYVCVPMVSMVGWREVESKVA